MPGIADLNLEPLVAKAILDTLTPEARENILAVAVKELITTTETRPSPSGYGTEKVTPLQVSFNQAVRNQMTVMVREYMAADEDLRARLRQLFVDAVEKAFSDDNRGALVDKIADHIGRAMTGERY